MATGSSTNRDVSQSIVQWKRNVAAEGASRTIVRLGSNPIKAASTFHYQHFLGLRILWDIPAGKRSIPPEIMKQFDGYRLRKGPGFDEYLREIRKFDLKKSQTESFVPADLGAFVNV